jgi:HSP20 family protein
MVLVPWRWYEDLSSFSKEMNQLFDRFFGRDLTDRPWEKASFPPVTVSETENHVLVHVEIHGFLPRDLEISFQPNLLIIKGKRTRRKKDTSDESPLVKHVSTSFVRKVRIHRKVRADAINAKYRDGVLLILLPKAIEMSTPFRVDIE